MGTRVRVRPVPWSSPDAYRSGGNPSLSHRWAKWHSRLMAPIESRTPDWRMGFGLQTARTGLRYRAPCQSRSRATWPPSRYPHPSQAAFAPPFGRLMPQRIKAGATCLTFVHVGGVATEQEVLARRGEE